MPNVRHTVQTIMAETGATIDRVRGAIKKAEDKAGKALGKMEGRIKTYGAAEKAKIVKFLQAVEKKGSK